MLKEDKELARCSWERGRRLEEQERMCLVLRELEKFGLAKT